MIPAEALNLECSFYSYTKLKINQIFGTGELVPWLRVPSTLPRGLVQFPEFMISGLQPPVPPIPGNSAHFSGFHGYLLPCGIN